MPIQLPKVIADYFEAAGAHDADGVSACFLDDAQVRDEAKERSGLAAIRAWIEEASRRYRPAYEPLDVEESAGQAIVRCRVSGDFPGSPVTLRHAFELREGRIARLEIQ